MAAAALKEIFNAELVRAIAAEIRRTYAPFDTQAFVALAVDGLDDLELSARAWQIAEALRACLPPPFRTAAAILEASLGPELPATGNNGPEPLRYLPQVFFVQKYGLDDFDAAMRLQAALTKRFSAESSIRAFLTSYPERTYQQMLTWAKDQNPHLRRLASEGTRPRLPWAPRLRAYQETPQPVLALLELLKDDDARYVQRSVANNLNDIAKDHPALVVETCRRWAQNASPGRAWVIRHALRSLIKAGNKDAIRLLGGAMTPQIEIKNVRITPGRVTMGGKIRLLFEVVSTSSASQHLLIDYAVHFVKANGRTNRKVFKLRAVTLQQPEAITLGATLSTHQMTTRRHYPGLHRIEAVVNGEQYPLGAFLLAP
jgi:3-methyladenine DNA glycosylase AlkC